MKVDLHTHSNCSDGALTPQALLDSAAAAGVELLSITDHDVLSAYPGLRPPAGLRVLPGVEFSAAHGAGSLHVVGLGVDPAAPVLLDAAARQRAARERRAARIAAALAVLGVPQLFERACARAGDGPPARPDFAAVLVEAGCASDAKQAFKRYLGPGRRGDQHSDWPALAEVIGWIQAAGGRAVLAHPARYSLTRTRLNRLVGEFRAAGGDALEVISGRQSAPITHMLAQLATRHDLLASLGSDFHSPAQHWLRLGGQGPLPAGARPVWEGLEGRTVND